MESVSRLIDEVVRLLPVKARQVLENVHIWPNSANRKTTATAPLEVTTDGEPLPVSWASSLSFRLPQEWEDAAV